MLAEVKEKIFGLFSKYGIKSVSMDDISRELGISKKTLYHTIDSKGGLVELVCMHTEQMHIDKIEKAVQDSSDAVEGMWSVSQVVNELLRNISLTTIYDLTKYYPSVWSQIKKIRNKSIYATISNNIKRGKENQLYRDDVDEDILAKIFISSCDFFLDDEMFPKDRYRIQDLYQYYIEYHIRGIATQKGMDLLETYKKQLEL